MPTYSRFPCDHGLRTGRLFFCTTCEDNFKTWADSHGQLATLELGCCLTYPRLQHLASSMFPEREEDGAGDSCGEARMMDRQPASPPDPLMEVEESP